MKLVSLNVFGGSQGQILLDYVSDLAGQTDIFCFQEVLKAQAPAPKISGGSRSYLFDELSGILSGHFGRFCSRIKNVDISGNVDYPIEQGLAIFSKRDIKSLGYQEIKIADFLEQEDHPSEGDFKAQFLKLEWDGRQFVVINYHGISRPGNKLDTSRRIATSENLQKLFTGCGLSEKILCGDFNLYPQTQSIRILETVARNLISEYKIKNTRNKISWKQYPNGRQTFADFMFVSSQLEVVNFAVPYNEVSDHLPMMLEFEL